MKIRILSDDLTGANDVALKLLKYGIKATTRLNWTEQGDESVDIFSSETRSMEPEAACQRVYEIFGRMRSDGYDKFYKKIDSALRGNIESEIRALLQHLDSSEKIILVPTYPASKRALIDGKLLIDGTEVSKTAFRDDPVNPIRDSRIQSFVPCKVIGLEKVRSRLTEAIAESTDERIVAIEGQSEADIESTARALLESGFDRNVVGSPPILEHLLGVWGYKREKVLIVSGSCNTASLKQSAFMKNQQSIRFLRFELGDELPLEEIPQDVIFVTTAEEEADGVGLGAQDRAPRISKELAGQVARLARAHDIHKIAISGGETAIRIFEVLGIPSLTVEREVGLAVAFGRYEQYEIVTKPGSYGAPDVYQDVLRVFGK